MTAPKDMTNDELVAALLRFNPFGGYSKRDNRDSLVKALERYRSAGGKA